MSKANPNLPITIPSSIYPLEPAAILYQEYYTGELRLTVSNGYMDEQELENLIKAYNFIKYGSGPE